TYGHAQKIRAAMSHKFGRECKLGCQTWEERDGQCSGNPSLSLVVSQYMISLRRRKVREGEVVTSARAIDEETIRQMYAFNQSFTEAEYGPKKRKQASSDQWAGKDLRIMLHALYVIAFHCLLRFDEALRIEWHWIEWQEYSPGKVRLKVKLPFRKTHQTGGIAPFYLYTNQAKPHLCPVKAVAEWLLVTHRYNPSLKGFVFKRKVGNKFSENIEHQMSPGSFMECFRNNLVDIGVDPRPYGTHSFRRGGAQHLVKVRRWPIPQVCSWGGWSDNGDMATLFKYLLSWNDDLMEREDYFNPEKQRTEACRECGRTCLCF
ncbi:DNA breaking-rejoining enzyme, partial [Stereum hirsutum FP-91666 SS1]|uniref:DNA breaking-rejoining enzyme n=1 Tax=Stereum hirsutum (strain FP-91666) TaxID=721885 RepID=UPI00044105F0